MSKEEDFRADKTKALEERAIHFIKALCPNTERANYEKINETDILVNGSFVDFQYSTNFERFKDLRFDLIAAGYIKNDLSTRILLHKFFYDDKTKYKDFKEFLNNWIDIKKYGKILNTGSKSRPQALIYFIYNKKESEYSNIKEQCPDFIYVVKTDAILEYINKNWIELVNKVQLHFNIKMPSDRHEGLFITLPFFELIDANVGAAIDALYFYEILNNLKH